MNRRQFLYGNVAASGLLSAMTAQLTRSASSTSVADQLVAVHTMVDMPEWCANLGKNWDAKAYVRACKEAHVEVIELKTKNAMGHGAFPFKERPCPHDLTTETRELASREGMQFIAYYNVGLDNW